MTNRNPFRIIEKIGRIAGYTLLTILVVGSLALFVFAIASKYDMGWWGLLLIPGIPIGCLGVGIILGLIAAAFRWVGDRWDDAKYKWDNRNS